METKGLPNIGNSCYLNSSIQLCKLISDFTFKDDNNIMNVFISDIQSVSKPENMESNDPNLNIYLRLYGFIAQNLQYQIGSQQDSCEVVQFITDKYADLIQEKNKLLSVFNQVVSCLNCNKYRIVAEQKESMLISHELNNNTNEEIDFRTFFTSIFSSENLEGHNTECNCTSPRAHVRTVFTSLPDYLFIKVGRCRSDLSKIYKKLKFESVFELDYPLNLQNNIQGIDKSKLKKQYQIIGMIIHHGQSMDSGHYSSIIKSPTGWMYCDDLNIKEIDINVDLEYIQMNCCVLLYRSSS